MKGENIHFENLQIEPMALRHLDEVLAIEKNSFSSPWSRASFRQEIANKKFSVPIVARIGVRVVGYGIAWIVIDEIYIGNIAVHRDYRRKGIGELLLQKLLERGSINGCQLATLEVRKTNQAAIELYTKFGFSAVALRKGYYRDTGEDAIAMVKYLTQEVQTPAKHELAYNV